MNIFNIEKSFKLKAERNWDTLYLVIDAHGTIVRPYHTHLELYPECIEVLQWFTKRKDFKIILWSSSHLKELENIDILCIKNGIVINAINQNPDEHNTQQACFDHKFYFNILIDDKSSFDPEYDWLILGKELERITGEKVIEWNEEKIKKLKEGISKMISNLNSLITF